MIGRNYNSTTDGLQTMSRQSKLNPIFARLKFNSCVQGAQPVEQFITQLRVLAKDCNYSIGVKNEMIRDCVVFGTSSKKVREKLITKGEKLTFYKAIQIAQSYEYSQEQLKTMSTSKTQQQFTK